MQQTVMKKVIRTFGKNKEKILCNIPPELYQQKMGTNFSFELNNFDQLKFGDFSISAFLNRYLAGNRSLKESRSVSRKRLALVNSGVGYIDPLAIDLAYQIRSYNKALSILSEIPIITLEHLLEVNFIIATESKTKGTIRSNQNWIDGNSPVNSSFVFPPPEYVHKLITDWISFINDPNVTEDQKAIFGHNQLIGIHPFSNGNGRTGRIFLQAILEKKYGEIIHPCLYRLDNKNDTYIQASVSTLTSEGTSGPLHQFWTDSIDWGNITKQKMYAVLEKGKIMMNNRIVMVSISDSANKLLNYLWAQPIVCEVGLMKKFKWSFSKSKTVIQELVNAQVLEVRKLSAPQGAVIYDCPLIFDLWQQLDDLVFDK
jgi:fido (protein-threonine AMPylation protein)|tara:strand:- start:606 stop:1718 length:1113 start_codon:yes stop_codon:yes gene_type:complete